VFGMLVTVALRHFPSVPRFEPLHKVDDALEVLAQTQRSY
jgi:hypothetical protein